MLRALLATWACVASLAAHALDPGTVSKLATGDGDEKAAAVAALAASGDARAMTVLKALADGEAQVAGSRLLIVKDGAAVDAATGEAVSPLPDNRDDVVVNNRLRREIDGAMAMLRLFSPERDARAAAVKELANGADDSARPLIGKALAAEKDPEIHASLAQIAASLDLESRDKPARLAAIRLLAASANPSTKSLLVPLALASEPDADVRREAIESLKAIDSRLARSQFAGLVFSGVSLGSILLLAALGLAITYGLMGVINMAHGELIMIGAYTTYVVQNFFRSHLGGAFDWYLAMAVPASFVVSAAVGMALERAVIRWLYGRPLETLLATWGISLVLIQGVRSIFGAQNVQVENPAFMSGGLEILAGVVLPYSRIVIIAFAGAVLVGVGLLLARTRLGLFVRGVTQNRAMAACVGVPTARVDTWAFGLGSGLAGLAGCALSQIGNVGPDLGQSYIVDSFMVVVLGGVGQLAGTVYAALGLGFANKLLESWSGAVLAKIAVLVFIIVFIQKRPQGMFALKGRAVES
ncbi:MAG TPA: urea ABC transporter permease subunit UrtB [Usitatibacter sp.]|nr:urea ABC transporter permease subunit UrtB [Usitatibacter sp.]